MSSIKIYYEVTVDSHSIFHLDSDLDNIESMVCDLESIHYYYSHKLSFTLSEPTVIPIQAEIETENKEVIRDILDLIKTHLIGYSLNIKTIDIDGYLT